MNLNFVEYCIIKQASSENAGNDAFCLLCCSEHFTCQILNFTASGQVRDKNESRFEEVTYSTVKASSTDPSHICASVNPSS